MEAIGGDDGALWITLMLMAGAAERVVCRMDRRRCTFFVTPATARWSRCFCQMAELTSIWRTRCVGEWRRGLVETAGRVEGAIQSAACVAAEGDRRTPVKARGASRGFRQCLRKDGGARGIARV